MHKTKNYTTLLLIILLVILTAGVVYLGIRISSMTDTFDERLSSMAEGLNDNSDNLDQLKAFFLELAADTNEIRSTLLLPERRYHFSSDADEGEGENGTEFFRGVDTIIQKNTRDEALLFADDFFSSREFRDITAELSLEITEESGVSVRLVKNGNLYFTVEVREPHSITLESYTGDTLNISGYSDELEYFLESQSDLVAQHYAGHEIMKDRISSALRDPDITAVLKDNQLVAVFPEELDEMTAGTIETKDGRVVVRYGIDGKTNDISVAGAVVEDVAAFKEMLIKVIGSADTRTEEEIRIDRAISRVTVLSEDEGFQAFLQSKGLTLSETPREDNDYIYFDLIDEDGERIGSFAVQKMIGEVYLMDKDDVPISSLKREAHELTDEKKN